MATAIENYLTTNEAAKAIGVTPIRVRQFAQNGRLPSVKLGFQLLFDRKQVERFRKTPRKTGRPKKM